MDATISQQYETCNVSLSFCDILILRNTTESNLYWKEAFISVTFEHFTFSSLPLHIMRWSGLFSSRCIHTHPGSILINTLIRNNRTPDSTWSQRLLCGFAEPGNRATSLLQVGIIDRFRGNYTPRTLTSLWCLPIQDCEHEEDSCPQERYSLPSTRTVALVGLDIDLLGLIFILQLFNNILAYI